ncbi:NAD(P)H dehydrogenase (quinone) [Methanosalsum zhilinae DSM 4017]|uniref:NAD(P)H dehydrogenase (Quinone) n=1 Tax=Methanosalsum zhilinae (strain DSM 4017 / NBRC 107636 / OCM 62 / WeN5) TaxID=679901 RepID=F7XMZ3_METZD|nr:NAD(P)H-dependent oxidoreductase [Methanosalsum zhilinae]AEH61102.1 NAD(P)H dehydrogenase (quinone) [Methanosalsum zhilinae DSM 4017]
MNILYIFAHPDRNSFNFAMKERAVKVFNERQDSVQNSDLYEMDFNPILRPEDFKQRKYKQFFNPFLEQLNAVKTNGFSEDIRAEMNKVNWADILIFQFPLYFTSVPAIMKGWIDRIFAAGFAFNPVKGEVYEKGLLKGKKALLVITAGADKKMYSPDGLHGDINELLRYITHCTFEFTGMEVLPSYIIYETNQLSEEEGIDELEKYERFIESL